jgi:hypothetical protein
VTGGAGAHGEAAQPEPRPPIDSRPPSEPRPLIERLGLAVIALVVTAMFGAIAVAALGGGELFLAVMGGVGALMTVWAAVSTLRRG